MYTLIPLQANIAIWGYALFSSHCESHAIITLKRICCTWKSRCNCRKTWGEREGRGRSKWWLCSTTLKYFFIIFEPVDLSIFSGESGGARGTFPFRYNTLRNCTVNTNMRGPPSVNFSHYLRPITLQRGGGDPTSPSFPPSSCSAHKATFYHARKCNMWLPCLQLNC